MDSEKFTQLLNNDNAIQRIAYAVELVRNDYTIQTINDVITNYDFANELLDLQNILLYMNKINEYNSEWATKEKDKMYELKQELNKTCNFTEKLEVINIEKCINEDLDYIIGNKSMPNIRNIKRLNALKMILSGKSYDEIVQLLS